MRTLSLLAALALLSLTQPERLCGASFTNASPVAFASTVPNGKPGPSIPYPSTLTVASLSGTLSKITVTLNGLSHERPDDIQVLLVGPTGAKCVLMADTGGTTVPASNLTLTFDDTAASLLPDAAPLGTGTFRPTCFDAQNSIPTDFPAPAPPGPYGVPQPRGTDTLTSLFAGSAPNGVWSLYTVDDVADKGPATLAKGWSLTITTGSIQPTATALSSSLNPSFTTAPGNSVTLTATVRLNGTPVNGQGNVLFRDGATSLGAAVALNASGQASLVTSSLSEGTHALTAVYSGTPSLSGSSAALVQIVDRLTVVSGNAFCNPSPIALPDNASPGSATVYPSRLRVSGAPTTLTKVTVTLNNLKHPRPDDMDLLLVGPTGARFFLVSDAGGTLSGALNATITLDDSAASFIPDAGPLASGTYKPSAYGSSKDVFAAPAPAAPYPTASPSGSDTLASVFNGTNPNGIWSLYLMDDVASPGEAAEIAGGWCLTVLGPPASINGITRNGGPTTRGNLVSWTLSFDQPIGGLTATNLSLSSTGLGGLIDIESVIPSAALPSRAWVVTGSTGSGEGTLRLDLINSLNLTHSITQIPVQGQTWNVDNLPPAATLSAPSETVTTNGPVSFTVTYVGASLVNLTPSDVILNTSHSITGLISVTGSGLTTRTVTLSNISGVGSLGISLRANTARDTAGNLAPAAGPSTTFRTCTYIAVATSADNGPGSLRQALLDVCPPGLIDFSTTAFSSATTLALSTLGDNTYGPSALRVDKPITLIGPAGSNSLTLARSPQVASLRLFYITTNGSLTLRNLTLSQGLALGSDGGAGGQRGGSGGGAAGLGGAIFNQGKLEINGCSLIANQAIGGNGGGGLGAGLGSGAGGGGLQGPGAVGGNNIVGGIGGPPLGGSAGANSGGGGSGGEGGGGGGGGSGTALLGSSGPGGAGGFAGGGGGGGAYNTAGFGGGAGGGGGLGGFAGGGGGAGAGTPDGAIGLGGFGGGNGSHTIDNGNLGGSGGGGGGFGAAVFNHQGTCVLSESVFVVNATRGGRGGTYANAPAEAGAGLGAVVFNRGGTLKVSHCTFIDNQAGAKPGGLFTLGGRMQTDTAPEENCLRTYFAFDRFNLRDASGVATPVYFGTGAQHWSTDHRGHPNSAIALNAVPGNPTFGVSNYYRLTTAIVSNSNLELGLKGDFTVSAWILPKALNGDKMVLGNTGPGGTGSLLFGLRGGRAYFGFWANDLAGVRSIPIGSWTHLAWRYSSFGGQMSIYVNGELDASTVGRPNTTKDADILLGYSEAIAGSYFQGFIDEFTIFCEALEPNQIAAIAAPTGPPPASTLAPHVLSPGLNIVDSCRWNVREIYGHVDPPGLFPFDLATADYLSSTPQLGKVAQYTTSLVNRGDNDDGFNNVGYFGGDDPFGLNNLTPQGLINSDDNYFVLVARGQIQIGEEDDYTFGFATDDGARLRILGATFKSSSSLTGGNPAVPAHRRDTLAYVGNTGNSATLGVVHLKPGVHEVEFLTWEVGGHAFAEVFAARGAKSSLDQEFSLVSPVSFLPGPQLTITPLPRSSVQISWAPQTLCDQLESANSVSGPWKPVNAKSGDVFSAKAATLFFRVVR